MEQGVPNQYTAEDIVRYHQGLLTPQEMHRMERAALDDPFLADAMEGYVHARDPLEEVASLKQELNRRTGKKAKILPMRSWPVLKIAALLLLLAGFAWIAYQYNIGNNNLALNPGKTAQDAPQPAVPRTGSADSIGNRYAAPAAGDQARVVPPAPSREPSRERKALTGGEPATATAAPTGVETADADLAAEQADKEETMARSVKPMAAPAAAGSTQQAQERSIASPNHISGRVVDNNNMPVPHAQLNVLQQKTYVRADTNGVFSIPVQDSFVTVTVQSVGYEERQASLKNNAANRIVLQPSETALNEVVISKKSIRRQAETRVALDGAEPVSDARNYERFILERLKPFESMTANANGTVELAFDIDATGKPIHIEVERSLCTPCDSAAIKALQEGPLLKKTRKTRKASARIKF